MIYGIDVAPYQPKVDWSELYTKTDCQFAFIKFTEGNGWVSKTAQAQWAGATELFERTNGDFFAGPYHFCRWETPGNVIADACDEADHFYETVGPLGRGNLDPVADVEWITDPQGKAYKRDPDELVLWVRTFLERCEVNFGRSPYIYTGPSFWRYCLLPDKKDLSLELTSWKLWIVDYNSPAGKPKAMKDTQSWAGKPWHFHQYSGKGRRAGVYNKSGHQTDVDLNVFNGTFEELRVLAYCG